MNIFWRALYEESVVHKGGVELQGHFTEIIANGVQLLS